MQYVDGFVLVVQKKNLNTYKKMAAEGGRIWMKCGAVAYVEALGEDMDSAKQWGGLTFPAMAKAKKDEVIIFSYIVFKSRKHRDQVNKKVHAAMEKNEKMKSMEMPFEMNRMAYGGFEAFVDR